MSFAPSRSCTLLSTTDKAKIESRGAFIVNLICSPGLDVALENESDT